MIEKFETLRLSDTQIYLSDEIQPFFDVLDNLPTMQIYMSKESWRVGVSNHKVNNKCSIIDNEFGYNKVPKKTMLDILKENLV